MKKTIIIILSLSILIPALSFSMGSPKHRGVILFFKGDNIILKTNETRLEDICDAISNLTGVNITVDDVLLYENVTVDIVRNNVEDIIFSVIKEIPSARYIKILKREEEKEDIESFIIFSKSGSSKAVPTEFYNKKMGLQEAFVARHNAVKISGKLSVSGLIKLNGIIPYRLPEEILNFSEFFIEDNKTLLNLRDVKLRVLKAGNDYLDYKQYYKGIPIDNLRSYALQIKYLKKDGNSFIMVSNNTIPEVNTSVQPKVTESEAIALVIDEIRKLEKNSKLYLNEDVIPEGIELKIMPQLEKKTDIIAEKFKDMSLYWSVHIDFYSYYVDAKTGKVYKEKSL